MQYTRKSTEEGLEQEFNSLDAQREAGEAYIMAGRQAPQIWVSLLSNDTNLIGDAGIMFFKFC